MPSENFERKMREKLGQVEVPPRPEVWEALQAQLLPPSPRRRGAALLWLGAMAVSTAAALTLLWLFWPGSSPSSAPAGPAPFQAEARIDTASPNQPLPPPSPLTPQAELSPNGRPVPWAETLPPSPPASSPTAASPSLLALTPLPLPNPPRVAPQGALTGPLPVALAGSTGPAIAALSPQAEPDQPSPLLAQPPITHEPLPPLDFPTREPRVRGWSYRLQAGSAFQGSGESTPLASSVAGGNGLQAADYVNVSGGQTRFGNLPAENLQTVNLPQTQVNASFRLEYRLNRHWGLESGLGLTLFAMGRAQSTWFAPNSSTDFENLSGPVDPSQLEVQASEQVDFQPVQMELPLYLNRYLPGPGRGQFLLSTGLSFNTGLTARPAEDQALLATEANSDRALNPGSNLVFSPTTSPYTSQVAYPEEALLGLRRFHSHAALRLLYQLPLSGRHALFVGPEVRYQLTPMYQGAAASVVEPYHLGFQLGLRL